MKKENKILIIIFFILVSLFLVSSPGFLNITGKFLINIKAVYEKASVSISVVDNIPPNIVIYYPLNDTYNYKENIYLYYTVSDKHSTMDKVWYNLDNGNNITLIGNTTFNVIDEGSHTLYIFANDSSGSLNNTETITFFVNTSLGYIIISDYNGTTTDFDSLNKEEQETIGNMILEYTGYGKILFNELINISDDNENAGEQPRKVINLSAYTGISFNRIFINTTELLQLNKSATLSLYNLNFTNPRILRDGLLCPSEICTKVSYTGGVLIFNVTSFLAYSAEESPVAPARGAGGGTRAVVKEKVSDFTVDKDLIKVVLKQGETKKEFLEIENTGETELDMTIDLGDLKDFVIFPTGVGKYSFKLEVGEKQSVQLIFNIAEDQKPDVYPGKIIIKGGGLQTIITTIIEIESKQPIFDIELNILEEFKEVAAGEGLLAEITLYNLAGIGLIDVSVDYAIIGLDGKAIIKEHETVAVETRTSFIKRFTIPSSAKPGSYILYAKVTYDGVVGSSSSLFEVVEKPHVETPAQIEKYFYILYLVIAVIVVFVILMFYQYIELKKLTKSIKKVRAEDLIKTEKIKYKGGK